MTKSELIKLCRAENPTMTATINDETFLLSAEEYEQALNDWAEMRLVQIEAETTTPIAAVNE
jgi:hypothetical protein